MSKSFDLLTDLVIQLLKLCLIPRSGKQSLTTSQTLTGSGTFELRRGDWKTAYYLLENVLGRQNPYTTDALSDPITTSVLLELGCDPSADGDSAIHMAVANGDAEVVRILLTDKRVNAGTANDSAIRMAVQARNAAVIELLLANKRVDPSTNHNYAIRLAAQCCDTEVVRLLLAHERVDPSARDNYAVHSASRNGNAEVVRLLLADSRVSSTVNGDELIRAADRSS